MYFELHLRRGRYCFDCWVTVFTPISSRLRKEYNANDSPERRCAHHDVHTDYSADFLTVFRPSGAMKNTTVAQRLGLTYLPDVGSLARVPDNVNEHLGSLKVDSSEVRASSSAVHEVSSHRLLVHLHR